MRQQDEQGKTRSRLYVTLEDILSVDNEVDSGRIVVMSGRRRNKKAINNN